MPPRTRRRGEPPGFLAVVLHAHLPYVRHPVPAHFLEETWLFEALTECYVPLLAVFRRLAGEGVPYRLTVSLSPTLVAMLDDAGLRRRYRAHVDALLRLAEREARSDQTPGVRRLAAYYRRLFAERLRFYEEELGGDVVGEFRRLQQAGYLDILATAATHPYLPLWVGHPAAVRAQIALGTAAYERAFRRRPRGFWLPECGFHPAAASELTARGIDYTVLDAHGLVHARPRPSRAVFAPAACAATGLLAFGRDPAASAAVWSADRGYPAHPLYRDFHRDIGLEKPLSPAEAPWLAGGVRSFTGLKYYRVTGRGPEKALYDPRAAALQAVRHGARFVADGRRRVRCLSGAMDVPPVLVAPYDAELFGHWWFEGPVWLETVMRLTASGASSRMRPATLGALARRYRGRADAVRLALSSWGEGGYSRVWLNPSNDEIAVRLHRAWHRLEALAKAIPRPAPPVRRTLNQGMKELLLAQGSDWAFMLHRGTTAAYARRRVEEHLRWFWTFAAHAARGVPDQAALEAREKAFPLFPDLDTAAFLGSGPGSLQGGAYRAGTSPAERTRGA